MVSLISHAGVLDAILKFMQSKAKSDLSAEVAAGAMVSIVGIAISSGTSAITFCGPIIRSLLRPFKIDRARAANLLDGLGCGVDIWFRQTRVLKSGCKLQLPVVLC